LLSVTVSCNSAGSSASLRDEHTARAMYTPSRFALTRTPENVAVPSTSLCLMAPPEALPAGVSSLAAATSDCWHAAVGSSVTSVPAATPEARLPQRSCTATRRSCSSARRPHWIACVVKQSVAALPALSSTCGTEGASSPIESASMAMTIAQPHATCAPNPMRHMALADFNSRLLQALESQSAAVIGYAAGAHRLQPVRVRRRYAGRLRRHRVPGPRRLSSGRPGPH
jgi:hypothetical protein